MNTNNTTPAQRPILFSTPMVQAILAGRKTETRRVVKGYSRAALDVMFAKEPVANAESGWCPYGQPGDVLWVRETWQQRSDKALKLGFDKYIYKATFNRCTEAGWKPSIHMPKAAARIWLQVTEIKVERLQDITEIDAKAEGAVKGCDLLMGGIGELLGHELEENYTIEQGYSFKKGFQSIWQSINGPDSWAANPWVWVVKFKVLSTTGKPQNL